MTFFLDCLQSVFLSKYFSRDYEEKLFSLKENGTRQGRGTRLAFFSTRPYHPVSPSSLHGQRHGCTLSYSLEGQPRITRREFSSRGALVNRRLFQYGGLYFLRFCYLIDFTHWKNNFSGKLGPVLGFNIWPHLHIPVNIIPENISVPGHVRSLGSWPRSIAFCILILQT